MIQNLETSRRQFFAPKDVAKYLAVTTRTVYHWIDKGALTALKIEGTVRISREELLRITALHRIQ